MKQKLSVIIIFIIFVFTGCQNNCDERLREKSKKEIAQTEKEFEAMASEKGLAEAFAFYAADSAALSRGDSICIGKENIRKIYEKPFYKNVKLRWSPDFVDASLSGELGYTYGKYIFTVTDSSGKVNESRGYFHTVWKKQNDGKWRFVWD